VFEVGDQHEISSRISKAVKLGHEIRGWSGEISKAKAEKSKTPG
jgi:hypothetical protein